MSDALGELWSLERLNLSNNGDWTELPDGVEFFSSLRELDLRDNDISWLPVRDLCALPKLAALHCTGNKRMYCPPPLIASAGGEVVMTYLRKAVRHGEGNIEIEVQVGCVARVFVVCMCLVGCITVCVRSLFHAW